MCGGERERGFGEACVASSAYKLNDIDIAAFALGKCFGANGACLVEECHENQ